VAVSPKQSDPQRQRTLVRWYLNDIADNWLCPDWERKVCLDMATFIDARINDPDNESRLYLLVDQFVEDLAEVAEHRWRTS